MNRASRVAYDPPAMVKADLFSQAMDAASLEDPVARKALEALLESLGAALQFGDRVVVRRFGVLHAAPRTPVRQRREIMTERGPAIHLASADPIPSTLPRIAASEGAGIALELPHWRPYGAGYPPGFPP